MTRVIYCVTPQRHFVFLPGLTLRLFQPRPRHVPPTCRCPPEDVKWFAPCGNHGSAPINPGRGRSAGLYLQIWCLTLGGAAMFSQPSKQTETTRDQFFPPSLLMSVRKSDVLKRSGNAWSLYPRVISPNFKWKLSVCDLWRGCSDQPHPPTPTCPLWPA